MNNDLISREALKKEFCKDIMGGLNWERIIDNAPTVEPEKVLVANVTFDKDKLEQIVRDQVIEPIKNGELVIKEERPTGEWITAYSEKKKKVNKCRVCGFISIQGKTNFCPNCGADMREEGKE